MQARAAQNNFDPNNPHQVAELNALIKTLESAQVNCCPIGMPLLGLGLMGYAVIDFLILMFRKPDVINVLNLLPDSVKNQMNEFANTTLVTYGKFIQPNTNLTCQNIMPVDSICQDVVLPTSPNDFAISCFNFIVAACKSYMLLELQALRTSTVSPANPFHQLYRLLIDFTAFALGTVMLVGGIARCCNANYSIDSLPKYQVDRINRFKTAIGHNGQFENIPELLAEFKAIRDESMPQNQRRENSWCQLFSCCTPSASQSADQQVLLENVAEDDRGHIPSPTDI